MLLVIEAENEILRPEFKIWLRYLDSLYTYDFGKSMNPLLHPAKRRTTLNFKSMKKAIGNCFVAFSNHDNLQFTDIKKGSL